MVDEIFWDAEVLVQYQLSYIYLFIFFLHRTDCHEIGPLRIPVSSRLFLSQSNHLSSEGLD